MTRGPSVNLDTAGELGKMIVTPDFGTERDIEFTLIAP